MPIDFPKPIQVQRLNIPEGAQVPDDLKGQVVDPAEFVVEVQKAVPDPLKADPHSVQHFVDTLMDQIDTFLEQYNLPRTPTELPVFVQNNKAMAENRLSNLLQIIAELWRARSVLATFHSLSDAALRDQELWMKEDPDGTSWYYKQVVGPLIDGQCYGPPSCTEAAIQNYGKRPLPITPVVAWPFIAMRAFAVEKASTMGWFSSLVQALADSIEETANLLAEAAKEVAEKAEEAKEALVKASSSGIDTAKTVGRYAMIIGLSFGGLWLAYQVWKATRRSQVQKEE